MSGYHAPYRHSDDDVISDVINRLTTERDEASAALARIVGAWDDWTTSRIGDADWGVVRRRFVEAVDAAREWVGTEARSESAPEPPRRVTCRICKTTLRDHHRSGYCPDCWPRVS